MEGASRIPEEVRAGLPEILDSWRVDRGGGAGERLVEDVEHLTLVFVEFLQSSETVETFSRGGATRAEVEEISARQREIGRSAVGLIEDFAALRRAISRTVEQRVDLSALDGGEVAAFFVKLMQASDWLTETALQSFDVAVQREMEQELGRARATDLITGLPDRDQLNRLLLPRAIAANENLAVLIFDVARFTETVAEGRVEDARRVIYQLAEAIREAAPEGAICARFGDDEICALLPGRGSEEAYQMAERVVARIAEAPVDFEVDAGVAEYPAHAETPDELLHEALAALNVAQRVGGGGIVIAHYE